MNVDELTAPSRPRQSGGGISFAGSNRGAALIITIFVLMHLYQIAAPPNGYHVWRESDTAVVAYNYFQFDRPLLSPMTNELTSMNDGLRMELPIYCWLVAWGYDLVGFTHVVPHAVTLLFACLGLFAFYRLSVDLIGPTVALFGLIALALSPLYFYYSFKIMPDIMMLSLTLCGAWLYLEYLHRGNTWCFILAAVSLSLAASIKPFALTILMPLLAITLRKRKVRPRTLAGSALFSLAAATLPALWIAASGWLLERTPVLGSFTDYLFSELFLKRFLLQWPWDLFIGWILLPAFLIGVWRAFRRQVSPFFLWWLAAGALIVVLTARYSRIHDYYSLILTPALAAFTGTGLVYLWQRRVGRVVVLALILIAPIGIALRVKDRFDPHPPFDEIRRTVVEVIPPGARVLVADNTRGAVPLYQLNRRGWSLASPKDTAEITTYIAQGAQYIVLDHSFEKEFAPWLTHHTDNGPHQLGPLYAYRLSRP